MSHTDHDAGVFMAAAPSLVNGGLPASRGANVMRTAAGWALVGIWGGALVTLLLSWLEQHPFWWWTVAVTSSTGLIIGIGLLMWPTTSGWFGQSVPDVLCRFLPGSRLLPLRDALLLAYQQCEASVGEGNFSAGFHGTPDAELSPYLDALASRRASLFARRSGSGRRLRVESAPGRFVLIPGTSDLAEVESPGTAVYENVAVRASEIKAMIDDILADADAQARLKQQPRKTPF
jgi:hypothetical protein